MSITAYTGLPGHGKSYGVVENVICKALKEKRTIYTNIPINADVCLERFAFAPNQFHIQEIIDNPLWWTEVFEPGAIIVIDEVWRLWPNGLKAASIRNEDKSFLAEHRHMVGESGHSTEIVLVTQDLAQIANFARNLVETTFRVVKLSKVGFDKKFRVDVYSGPVTGPNPPISRRDSEIHGTFHAKVYELYQSHTKSKTGLAGDETRIDKRFSVFRGVSFYLYLLLFLVAAIGLYFGAKSMSRSQMFGGAADTQDAQAPASAPTAPRKEALQSRTPAAPAFKFLSLADSFHITYNNGRYPNIEYRFMVEIADTQTRLTIDDLRKMQYAVVPINQCMAKINGPDFSGFALCKNPEEKKGWVENLVAQTP